MSDRPRWSYAQTRVQARHGERLQEADWRVIEAARSLDEYIERARATPLRRFAERNDARLSSHALERTLRGRWRESVAEVAEWVPASWREAVLWVSVVPELPILDAVRRGEAPPWAAPQQATEPWLAVLVEPNARAEPLAARWYARWRSLWPKHGLAERALLALAADAMAHAAQLDRASVAETSVPYRRQFASRLARIFRRQSGSPAAIFCHLALLALELERLRGGMVRRLLFEPGSAQRAA